MSETELLKGVINILLIAAILGIGIYVIHFLIVSGKKNAKDAPHALGLPAGSVRATLAMTLIVLFVFIAVYFYLQTDDPKSKAELGQSILTILGTLVVSVSAFYFGIKATEQGSKIAMDSFKKMNPNDRTSGNIPPEVILEAIKNNKDNWIQQYRCVDIKPGKKTSGNTNFELNCLVFYVVTKDITLDETNSIPPFITYNSKGTDYEIPTDVKLEGAEGLEPSVV